MDGRFVERVVGRESSVPHAGFCIDTSCAKSARDGSWHHVPLCHRRIGSALKQAREAAASKEVRIGGGVSVIRQYLSAGLIDEMHLAVSPVLLGEGENLFQGINLSQLGFAVREFVAGENATHVLISKR